MTKKLLTPKESLANIGGWQERHNAAIARAETTERNAHSTAFLKMFDGWVAYGETHKVEFGRLIGDDHFLGPVWLEIGKNLAQLLNGDTGQLDSGTLDAAIRNYATQQGFDLDNE